MKRTKTSLARKSAKKTQSPMNKSLKQVDLNVIREKIIKLVGNQAVHMVKTTMNEVEKGHYLAMKYLFEMIGLCPATAPEELPQEDSLAKTLLRRLQLPEDTNPCPEAASECAPGEVDAVTLEGDTVK